MNTLMWEHPLTARHFRQLAADAGVVLGDGASAEDLLTELNHRCPRLRVVAPQSKRLACGDVGVGALAPLDDITDAVNALLGG